MPYNQNKAIRQENHITHNQKRLKTLLLAYFFLKWHAEIFKT
ncbi:hypothetical protein HPHPP2B_1299 [Helicobacter pylori Hp P-2b]|nr:hypothetical protein HPHPP2B_1299 [Helicobacter pylori Hp P-2b]